MHPHSFVISGRGLVGGEYLVDAGVGKVLVGVLVCMACFLCVVWVGRIGERILVMAHWNNNKSVLVFEKLDDGVFWVSSGILWEST